MEYKKHYTEKELSEVVDWFKTHFDKLPESVYLDKATYIKDLKHTVTLYYDIVEQHHENPTYAAQIRHIFLMRDAVLREWKKQGIDIDNIDQP